MKPTTHAYSLSARLVAEGLGTAFLLAAVVGSGIMGERLSGGNVAVALLANTIATSGALIALIVSFGPISGAHLNPIVTLLLTLRRDHPRRELLPYTVLQLVGGVFGVAAAHLMFEERLFSASTHARAGGAQMLSEGVASLGLLLAIVLSSRHQPRFTPLAVGAYIAAAYWFTASTSFANPAVTAARCLSDTFAGIRPSDGPGFIAAQLGGMAAAWFILGFLTPAPTNTISLIGHELGGPEIREEVT